MLREKLKIFSEFPKDIKQFLIRIEIPISSTVYLFKLLRNYLNAENE